MQEWQEIALWLKDTLISYGSPGLFLVALCDSTFLTLPEVNDLMVMTLSIEDPKRMRKFAALAATGSTVGSVILYLIGRKGGERLLRRRFSEANLSRARCWLQKRGMLAIGVMSMLPPPAPFKLSVLSSGALGLPLGRFVVAVTTGRFVRYFLEGFLAVRYGSAAIEMVRQSLNRASSTFVLLAAIAILTIIAIRLRTVLLRRWN